jgi:hypothetical protein
VLFTNVKFNENKIGGFRDILREETGRKAEIDESTVFWDMTLRRWASLPDVSKSRIILNREGHVDQE